jgi:uncharacterized membrane protein YphA (DoxX/SURF4 family)
MLTRLARKIPAWGLGLVFLSAGLLKGADPAEFVRQVGTYGILTGKAAAALAYLLIPLEVALGAALLAGYRTRWAAAAGAILMAIFMAATAYAWSQGKVEGCGCFGSFASRTPGQVLVEDSVFLGLGIAAFLLAPPRAAGPRWRIVPVLTALTAAVLLSLTAYALPLDPLVTDLRIGQGVEKLPLRVSPVDLSTGDHLAALLDLDSTESRKIVSALNALSGAGVSVIAFYGGEVDEKIIFCFNYSPGFDVVTVPRPELKRLFRKLPRFFRIRQGRVAGIWEGSPPKIEELR